MNQSDHSEVSNVFDIQSKRAKKLIEQGLAAVSKGDLKEALKCFQLSSDIQETAEAYTYWAWMLSFVGQMDNAIEYCKKAISMDPDFGNPYNDIGTYYMKLGQLQDAVPWLEKAKLAKRYEPRHFPYLNLGRIYLSQCMFEKALQEFEVALQYDPHNSELRAVIARIRQQQTN